MYISWTNEIEVVVVMSVYEGCELQRHNIHSYFQPIQ